MANAAATELEPLADMVLAALSREYPYHLQHLLRDDADARAPRELTPSFGVAFDWHSAVHGHWCLARLLRLHPEAGFSAAAAAALGRSLSGERLAGELAYLGAAGREGFERPYGLAWLLQLAAELREWNAPEARAWRTALAPLEALARERLASWLPRLPWPVRSGEHSQTAFALGLAWDWARAAEDAPFAALLRSRALDWFAADVRAPIEWEPSGQDFLSAVLAEADLMRRVLPPYDFARWFAAFLPDLERPAAGRWLSPVTPADRADGKLAHLDGLNLSRAWMLEGVIEALRGAADSSSVTALERAAERHRAAGLAGARSEHYAGSHWLGSFAVYLITGRGLASAADRSHQ